MSEAMASGFRGRKSAPAFVLAAALIVGGSSAYFPSQDRRGPDEASRRVALLSPEEKAAKAAAKAAKADKAEKAGKEAKAAKGPKGEKAAAKAGKKDAQPKESDEASNNEGDDSGGGSKKFQCPTGQILDKRLKGCL